MSEAASTGGASAPQLINPNAGALGKHKMSAESFLDGFAADGEDGGFEADAEPTLAPRPSRDRPGKARPEKPKEEPDDVLEDVDLPEATEARDEEPSAAELDGDEEPEAPLLPNGKGTKENPLTLKDLPKDKFLEVKIDGQKVVVDLAEAVEGAYMRPEYFHRQVNFVKGELGKAKQIAERAVRSQEAFHADFDAWIQNPESVLGTFLEKHEEVLEHVAKGYARILMAEQKNPELRLRRIRARDERELQKRRQELDAREQNDRTTRETQSKLSQLQASWKPGLDAGLKAAGFPAWTAELQEEVGIRLERIRRRNGTLTAADWEAAVPAAAKAIGAQPASAPARRPAPAARPAARPEAAPPAKRAANGGGKDFDSMPHNVKMRDTSFFWR
jgi:hypothetical protein